MVFYVNSDCVRKQSVQRKSTTISNDDNTQYNSDILCISITVTIVSPQSFVWYGWHFWKFWTLFAVVVAEKNGNLLRLKIDATKTLMLTIGKKNGQSANEQSQWAFISTEIKV